MVATDVDAIQSYLLQSVHLHTLAGASNVVLSLDDEGPKRAVKFGGSPVVATGGIGLFVFADDNKAERFGQEIGAWYRRKSVSGHLSISRPVRIDSSKPFGAAAEKAFQDMELRKRAGYRQGEVVTIPQGRVCESCGKELAEKKVRIGRAPDVDFRWLGPACLRKNEQHDRYFWLNWLLETPSDSGDSPNPWWNVTPNRHVPHDFNKLAGEHDLGLVVADADGTGRVLKDLVGRDRTAWERFSQGLAKLTRNVLLHAINEIVPVEYLHSPGDRYLPVLPLFCGGDDLVIACRGDLALPLASSLCRFFAGAKKDWLHGGRLGLSAAVVVTRPGFPFRIAHRIAGELLRNAKRAAKDACNGWSAKGIGAVDYALITESMGDAESVLADRLIQSDKREVQLLLTGRPYKAADSGLRSIGGLAGAIEAVSADRFPRGKLQELRQLCSRAAWLPDQATPSAKEAHEVRRQIEARFLDWLRRTRRQSDLGQPLSELWKHLMGRSCQDAETPWLSAGGGTEADGAYRCPLGDLADAARLFGHFASD